tara:strand:+ start:41 stop:301 length:261 start_codon:yes stop_codon:yes gene_type:complete
MGRKALDIQSRNATAEAMNKWGIKEGDIVQYRYYDNPRLWKGIVAWNRDLQDYVIQCYRKSDIEYCGDGLADYIEITLVDKLEVLK